MKDYILDVTCEDEDFEQIMKNPENKKAFDEIVLQLKNNIEQDVITQILEKNKK